MRSIIFAAGLIALVFALGCNLAPHQRDSVAGRATPTGNAPMPTVENLVKYLNQNAASLKPDQAINSTNVDVVADAEAGRIGLSCLMICQAPRNFMMSGVIIGGNPAVDIGSNDKEFWFWIKESKPDYLYHCSYEALAQGAKVAFPFQPDMAITALGLAQYDPTKKYDLNIVKDNRGRPKAIELIEQARSPENKPIKKVTVFNFTEQRVPQPQVIAHIIKDEQDRIVCSANIRSAQQVGGPSGPIIPQMVDFSWPEQKMKMTMRIYNPRIVAMPPQKAADTFTRRNVNRPSVDLATGMLDGGGLERTGVTAPSNRRGG